MGSKLTFNELVASIQEVHEQLAAQAGKAVNVSLTLRNWAIGCYLRKYEQRGADRATYKLLNGWPTNFRVHWTVVIQEDIFGCAVSFMKYIHKFGNH